MLEVKNIHKQYKTGNFIQVALDDVSLNLRDHEFVSILGPSGSGKTTLLNIIGGLDHYDSGDIVIDHVSTKDYKDRDWDSYRSHSVGFIFQSYNLIPHQTLLENVELALTISNVPVSERKVRAAEALEKVGLKEHMHKKPNQLSGGQMQRVAIARALVNNPKIILADEPTGALDSKTSVQVMELLKEVAEDRLVVMVTHNPELAREYSTRIVELKDGALISDSDPYVIDEKDQAPTEKRNFGKVGMSLWTSMRLSFNNLLSKRKRTLLVAFAGSIGIIGIALIMALSNGANEYIQNMEEETLSEYPLQISKAAFDLTSMMVNTGTEEPYEENAVHERQIISRMFGTVRENNLGALKTYLESGATDIDSYVNAIEYSYDVTPYIYQVSDKKVRQVNPDSAMAATGMTAFAMFAGGNMSTFSRLPETESLYQPAYEVLAGHWPENSGELVVVLTSGNGISDLALYNLGLKDPDKLENLVKAYTEGDTGSVEIGKSTQWKYEDFLGITLRMVFPTDMYEYDETVGCYTQVSETREAEIARNGKELKIVGIVRPMESSSAAMLSQGICYRSDLIYEIIETARNSEIVQKQLKTPDVNVFTGKAFDDNSSEFDLASLFSIDEEAVTNLFSFDADSLTPDTSAFSSLSVDLSGMNLSSLLDPTTLNELFGSISQTTIDAIFDGVEISITPDKMSTLFTELYDNYTASVQGDPTLNAAGLSDAYTAYFNSEEFRTLLTGFFQDQISQGGLSSIAGSVPFINAVSDLMQGYNAYCTANGLDPADNANLSAYLSTEEAAATMDRMSQAAVDAVIAMLTVESAMSDLVVAINEGYSTYAETNQLPMISAIVSSFENYLASEEAASTILSHTEGMIDLEQLSTNIETVASDLTTTATTVISQKLTSVVSTIGTSLATQIQSAMTTMMSSYMEQMSSMMDFSADSLADLVDINMSAEKMKSVLSTMLSTTSTDYDKNLKSLGYADTSDPESITFYPIDFDSKAEVVNILNAYNQALRDAEKEEDVVNFTDTVGTLMSSVTNIVDIIGYVLIAFVSISLVVSSIMIGVITYISVLERRKEIGILRAMGASKHNITQVFNCETIITGFLAGAIGVIVTWLLLIPGNIILRDVTDQPSLNAYLPIVSGLILVALSIVLTTLGGMLPSKGAAKQDPVIALRSE